MEDTMLNYGSLKGLQKYLQKLRVERQVLVLRLREVHQLLRSSKKQISEVERRIDHLKAKELTVSDHAVLRFIERVEALPPGEVRSRILTPKLKEMVATLGNGSYPVEGFSVRVQDNVVVTVIKES
jgi:hypothetical protein